MAEEFVKTKGLKELDQALADLGSVQGFKALRGGLMAASKPMFLAAKANALATGIKGRDSDATAASMGRWTRKETNRRTTLYLGPKSKLKKALAIYNAFHGTNVKKLRHFHLVEFGSVHGGAQPFLRPAFAATVRLVISEFGGHLAKQIEKIRKKHAAK
jgi:HK97 gp10 family phage protein